MIVSPSNLESLNQGLSREGLKSCSQRDGHHLPSLSHCLSVAMSASGFPDCASESFSKRQDKNTSHAKLEPSSFSRQNISTLLPVDFSSVSTKPRHPKRKGAPGEQTRRWRGAPHTWNSKQTATPLPLWWTERDTGEGQPRGQQKEGVLRCTEKPEHCCK